MRIRGGGGQKSEKFANVLYRWSLAAGQPREDLGEGPAAVPDDHVFPEGHHEGEDVQDHGGRDGRQSGTQFNALTNLKNIFQKKFTNIFKKKLSKINTKKDSRISRI